MNSMMLKSCAIAVVPSIMTLLLVQACGGSSDAVAQSTAPAADPIEGVWESVITVRDCTSGAVVRTFMGMNKFERGGTLAAVNNLPFALNGPALGVWRKGATAAGYSGQFRFYRFNMDGTPAGSQKLTHTITLDATGNASTGTIAAQVLDLNDAVVGTICAVTANTRVY